MKRVRFNLDTVQREPDHIGPATVVEILKESHPWLQDELGTL